MIMTNQVENPLTQCLLERKRRKQEMFEALRVLHEIMALRTSYQEDCMFLPDISVIFCVSDLVQKIDSLLLSYPICPSIELGRISEFWLEENCLKTPVEIEEMAQEYNRKGKTFLGSLDERAPQQAGGDMIDKAEARVTTLIHNVACIEREIDGFRDKMARLAEEFRGLNHGDEDEEED